MLGVSVQEGEHSSVQDAQATVRLYTMFRKEWEQSIADKRAKGNPNIKSNLKLDMSSKKKAVGKTTLKTSLPKYEDSDSD